MWTLLVTTVGPWLASAAAWLPGTGVLKALRVASYVVVLVIGGWGAVRIQNWWHGDKITVAEAKTRCDLTIAGAHATARLAAVLKRERAVIEREKQVAVDEDAIAAEIAAMKEARDASAKRGGSGGVVLRADDEWLRAWRAGRVERTRHR